MNSLGNVLHLLTLNTPDLFQELDMKTKNRNYHYDEFERRVMNSMIDTERRCLVEEMHIPSATEGAMGKFAPTSNILAYLA